MGSSEHFEDAALIMSTATRPLRRQLRALAWMTLEEVAPDAVAEDGRLVARTSARQVAERLGVDPGTAAGALRVLRDRGLLTIEREHGRAGRFGLSIYVVGPVPGLLIVPIRAALPPVEPPPLGNPDLDDDDRFVPLDGCGTDRTGSARPPMDGLRIRGPSSPSSLQQRGQKAFDLGEASS